MGKIAECSIALVIVMIVFGAGGLWSSNLSTPEYSVGELGKSFAEKNSGKLQQYVDLDRVCKNAVTDLFPQELLRRMPHSQRFSFERFKDRQVTHLKFLIDQMSASSPQQPIYRDGPSDPESEEARSVIRRYADNHVYSRLARYLLSDRGDLQALTDLLSDIGITAENYKGIAYAKDYQHQGKVYVGHCYDVGLKFVNQKTNREVIVDVQLERAHGIFGDRGVGAAVPFKPDTWRLRRINNLASILKQNDPGFFSYLGSQPEIMVANQPPGLSLRTALAPVMSQSTQQTLKEKGKQWLKKLW
jgi:hypothetical protein